MMTTYIVYGDDHRARKKPKSILWLLTDQAKWAMDARPFMIVDSGLLKKIDGETFAGESIERGLTSKYPYLRTAFQDQREDESEDTPVAGLGDKTPETEEAETSDKGEIEILFNSVAVIKSHVDNNDVDISALIESEEQGKNRKSLIKYLKECQSN